MRERECRGYRLALLRYREKKEREMEGGKVEKRQIEREVRRRLVCGAFTGVGPSFILPLQSVNTYLI